MKDTIDITPQTIMQAPFADEIRRNANSEELAPQLAVPQDVTPPVQTIEAPADVQEVTSAPRKKAATPPAASVPIAPVEAVAAAASAPPSAGLYAGMNF